MMRFSGSEHKQGGTCSERAGRCQRRDFVFIAWNRSGAVALHDIGLLPITETTDPVSGVENVCGGREFIDEKHRLP